MLETLLEFLRGLPPPLITICIAALPIVELRGAIPAAVALGVPILEAYLWACLGNLLPVIPLLLYLVPVSEWLRRFPFWRGFFTWFFRRTAARAQMVQRVETVGLALFVMVPLPMTGAWTGCAAASLFKLPFRVAFPAVVVGVLGAGLLVSLAVQAGLRLFYAAP